MDINQTALHLDPITEAIGLIETTYLAPTVTAWFPASELQTNFPEIYNLLESRSREIDRFRQKNHKNPLTPAQEKILRKAVRIYFSTEITPEKLEDLEQASLLLDQLDPKQRRIPNTVTPEFMSSPMPFGGGGGGVTESLISNSLKDSRENLPNSLRELPIGKIRPELVTALALKNVHTWADVVRILLVNGFDHASLGEAADFWHGRIFIAGKEDQLTPLTNYLYQYAYSAVAEPAAWINRPVQQDIKLEETVPYPERASYNAIIEDRIVVPAIPVIEAAPVAKVVETATKEISSSLVQNKPVPPTLSRAAPAIKEISKPKRKYVRTKPYNTRKIPVEKPASITAQGSTDQAIDAVDNRQLSEIDELLRDKPAIDFSARQSQSDRTSKAGQRLRRDIASEASPEEEEKGNTGSIALSPLQVYLRDIGRHPRLTATEEQEFGKQIIDSRQEIINGLCFLPEGLELLCAFYGMAIKEKRTHTYIQGSDKNEEATADNDDDLEDRSDKTDDSRAEKCLEIARQANALLMQGRADNSMDSMIDARDALIELVNQNRPVDFMLANIIRSLPANRSSGYETIAALRDAMQSLAEAKEQLINSNLRSVVFIARQGLRNQGLLLDRIQEGNLGLFKAAEKFDYRRGFRFATPAGWWIRQAIQRSMLEDEATIRLPVYVGEKANQIDRARTLLGKRLGRPVTDDEVGDYLGIEPDKVRKLSAVPRGTTSLDTPVGTESDTTLGELIEDTAAPDAFELIAQSHLREKMREIIDELKPREQEIIRLRFGLDGGEEKTLQEVGDDFGLTRERIRQIEAKVLNKLQVKARGLKNFIDPDVPLAVIRVAKPRKVEALPSISPKPSLADRLLASLGVVLSDEVKAAAGNQINYIIDTGKAIMAEYPASNVQITKMVTTSVSQAVAILKEHLASNNRDSAQHLTFKDLPPLFRLGG